MVTIPYPCGRCKAHTHHDIYMLCLTCKADNSDNKRVAKKTEIPVVDLGIAEEPWRGWDVVDEGMEELFPIYSLGGRL